MTDPLSSCFHELLLGIGEDCEREGLQRTPERAAQSFRFLTSGYNVKLTELLDGALFESDSSDLVIVKDIEINSLCEHHLLPFYGVAHIGYIPKGQIVGLSKIASIVDMFARRLQVQESLTQQISNIFMNDIKVAGVAVVIEATHMCMTMRGVQKSKAQMKTVSVKGVLQEDSILRNDFFNVL